MRKDRLLKLADHLETKVTDYCWEYGVVWCNLEAWKEDEPYRWKQWKQDVINQRDCGSVGCAIGHARALFPDFDRVPRAAHTPENFFGITPKESRALFHGEGYGLNLNTSTRFDVAAAIRQFVAGETP